MTFLSSPHLCGPAALIPGAVQKFPPRIAVLRPWAFCSSPPPRPKPCPALRGHCMRHDLPSSGQWDFLLCSRICCSLKQGGPVTARQGPQHPLAVQRGSTLCSWFEFRRCHPCSHLEQIHPAAQLLPSDGDGIFRADLDLAGVSACTQPCMHFMEQTAFLEKSNLLPCLQHLHSGEQPFICCTNSYLFLNP